MLVFPLAGCAGLSPHSPVIDVIGSYFPAWIICILIGIALASISRLLLIAARIDANLRPAILVYPGLILIFTLATWLAFFQN
jgi:hypothetical protein